MSERDNSFVAEHIPLVHSIASRFKGRGIEYDELFSAGCVGLVKAGNNFDSSRGLRFSTYAVPVIMGEIKQLFRDGGIIRVSRSLKELSLKISRLREEMVKNGEEPTISVIAEKLGVTAEEASSAIEASEPVISIYTEYDGEKAELVIPSEDESEKRTVLIALRKELSKLDTNDRRLIALRFISELTQSQTAELLGMTQVQVSRRERKILLLLREKLA